MDLSGMQVWPSHAALGSHPYADHDSTRAHSSFHAIAVSAPPLQTHSMQSQPQFGSMPVAPPPLPQQNPNGIPPLPVYTTQQPQFHWPNGAIQTTAQMTANAPIVPPSHNGFGIPITPTLAAGMRSGKKDPKRRTKTGCLTCRKRRIKCDEGHPVCRNCQKSKRECLGYDPIFKRETGHAPIQPAPSNTSTPTQSSKPPTPSIGGTYQGQQSQVYSATGGTFAPAPNPPQQAEVGTEYAAPSLDPALAPGGQSLTMATNSIQPFRKYKHLQIEQLFSINDILPPAAGPSVQLLSFDQATQHEMNDFYRFHFAPGLDKLFETNWYSTRGWQYIQQHSELPSLISQAMGHFRSEDPSIARMNQSLEARLVWQLATLPRSSTSISVEFLPRIDTVEHLIRGDHLHPNQVPPAPTVVERSDAIKYNEKNFWHNLGAFTAHYDENPDPDRAAERAQAINENLNTMRGILGIMESRDVLYSLAIGRHIGGKLNNFDPRQPLVPSSNDPNDEINKLEVARRHVEMESMKGLTQVVQVICRMAIRGWILQRQP